MEIPELEKLLAESTPGPWVLASGAGLFLVQPEADEEFIVCEVPTETPSVEVSHADAELIAAAPALARQLLDLLPLFGEAAIILKALSLGVEWELAPPIKKAIDDWCAKFEASPPTGQEK